MARRKKTARLGKLPKSQQAIQAGYRSLRESTRAGVKWKVAYLSDRVDAPTGIKYKVVWKIKVGGTRPETDEPAEQLREDGFGPVMDIVDEWVSLGRERDFLSWARDKHPTVIGANATGTCLFEALQVAVRLLGEPSAVPDSDVQSFLDESVVRGVDTSRGVSWKAFKVFLDQLRLAGSRLSTSTFECNLHCSGHRGVAAIQRLKLKSGVYVVGESTTMGVGHAFDLQEWCLRRQSKYYNGC